MSETKLPSPIKIGPFLYRVDRWYGLTDFGEDGKIHDLYGMVDHKVMAISIEAELAGEQQIETLLHEIIHGINWHKTGVDEMSEETIENFARGLTDVLLDNPALLEVLTVAAAARTKRRTRQHPQLDKAIGWLKAHGHHVKAARMSLHQVAACAGVSVATLRKAIAYL